MDGYNSTTDYGLDIGEMAPEFSLEDVDGNEIVLKQLLTESRGVLLNFFRGSW